MNEGEGCVGPVDGSAQAKTKAHSAGARCLALRRPSGRQIRPDARLSFTGTSLCFWLECRHLETTGVSGMSAGWGSAVNGDPP